MSELLTQQQLITHLTAFRDILSNFDYSALKNIRFLNLESLYTYMDTIKDNPFQRQYQALEKELDYLQPYLPFVSSERASHFIAAMAEVNTEQEASCIRQKYTQKLRRDFIDLARTTTTLEQWQEVVDSCESIRVYKEQMCLASYS